MNVKYISQRKLDDLQKFLETKDLSYLPRNLPEIMWRAKDLCAAADEEIPRVYQTESRNAWEDFILEFKITGEIQYFLISDDNTGKCWILDN